MKNDVDDKYIPYLEDEFGFVYTQRVSIAEIYHHGGLAALSLKLQDDDMNYYIIQVLGFSKEVADDIDYNSSTNGVLGNKKEIPMVSIDMRDDSFYFTYNMDGSTYIIIYKRHMKDRNKFYEIFE
ncbi:hypothetical protein AGMMS49975_13950 [Clostridia bacterium]|nr:hypothetical protein AGMMS49975_13950 [Clostridia bacterium]